MSSTLARILKTFAIMAVLLSAVLGAPATAKKGKGDKHHDFKLEQGPGPDYCTPWGSSGPWGYIDYSERKSVRRVHAHSVLEEEKESSLTDNTP